MINIEGTFPLHLFPVVTMVSICISPSFLPWSLPATAPFSLMSQLQHYQQDRNGPGHLGPTCMALRPLCTTMLVPYIPRSVLPYCLLHICFMTNIATPGMYKSIHRHIVRIVTDTRHHRQMTDEYVRERLRKGEIAEGECPSEGLKGSKFLRPGMSVGTHGVAWGDHELSGLSGVEYKLRRGWLRSSNIVPYAS